MPAYRLLDHTSDLMVELRGADLPELFSNTCTCLFDLMLDRDALRETGEVEVRLESPDLPELLLDWMRELLFRFSTDGFAPARVSFGELTVEPAPRLAATLHGERFDPRRHGLKLEVKTPTYHRYRLEKTGEGYRAVVVLDV